MNDPARIETILIIAAVLLALLAGYLIGSQCERDRQCSRRRAEPARPIPFEPPISDREWERFVCAIYELADRGEGQK